MGTVTGTQITVLEPKNQRLRECYEKGMGSEPWKVEQQICWRNTEMGSGL